MELARRTNVKVERFSSPVAMSRRWEELIVDGRVHDHMSRRDRLNPESNFTAAQYGPQYWVIETWDNTSLRFF